MKCPARLPLRIPQICARADLNMTLTASRHHKRSIALTMLLVWVFALLSGVANACLTEPRGELAHADI